MTVMGLMHPGEMGAAVGACLTKAGHTVLWDPSGRGPLTAERAAGADLTPAAPADLAGQSAVVLSVCPPHAALDVAHSVARLGFAGIYVDANAVSPGTAHEVAEAVRASGADYVDGGIVGSPPTVSGTTRLYLSGDRAPEVAALFEGTAVATRVLTASPYAASALKMSYAAWTKGSAALLLAAHALAEAEGVDEDLRAEWEMSQPELFARWERAVASATVKGWRWTGEMEEIAASMSARGLPEGFHRAAAEIFSSR